MLRSTLIPLSLTALLLGGCSSKTFTDVALTRPLHISAQTVSVAYAADTAQRELYQPLVESALIEAGITPRAEAEVSVVIAPRFIGDYMRYNNRENPIRTIAPLDETQLQEKIASERDAAAALQKSLYYRFSNADDFSSASQWSQNYALSAASAMLTAYLIDGIFDIDGWQMITDVYIEGKRTRVFAHTFDDALEPEESVARLAQKTADQIVQLLAAKGGAS